jgi:uncharacterized protein (TIGR02117 family)
MAMLLLCLAACSAVPQETVPAGNRQAGATADSIYVLRRGRHTDLILPVDAVRGPLTALAADFPDARYLTFGFGDRQYVLATHENLIHLLLAPLPGAGLLLVTGLQDTPADVYGAEHLLALPLRQEQIDAVSSFVWSSLQQNDQGKVPPYLPGEYPGNVYYPSSRTYFGLYTCNTWTAEALHSAGLPVHSAGVLLAGQVWGQAQAISAHETQAGEDWRQVN